MLRSKALLPTVPVSDPAAETCRWRRDVYARAVEAGVLGADDRLELEVYRHPAGDDYRDVTVLGAGETVTPLAAPAATIAVSDLLP